MTDTIEGGNFDGALFVGIEDGEDIFWDYRTDELVKAEPETAFDLAAEGMWVGEYLNHGNIQTPTQLGAFLRTVAEHEEATGMLGQRQAVVFALREMIGVPRVQTARALDISASTVDSALRAAREKVEAFEAVAGALKGGDDGE